MNNRAADTPKIALFRAHEDAAGSVARLRRLGFSVAHLPVIEIAPLHFAPSKPRYDAVVATSAKAFLSEAPLDRAAPLFVVGARTAREGEARGWRLAAPPAPDAERLAETIERMTEPGASVLYLAGRDRKMALEAALAARRALEVVEVYAAEARRSWRPREIRALASSAIALHYSQRSAGLAAGLAETAGLSGPFAAMAHICLSADVAAPLRAIGTAHLFVAQRPDEPSLLATLSHAARLFPSDRPYRI